MKFRLAFAAITLIVLSVVGCQPSGTPDPSPQNPPIGHVDCPEADGDCTGPDYV